jgi:hypothetical protein
MTDKKTKEKNSEPKSAFEEEAEMEQTGIIAEFVYFLMHNKKWWLTPIILVLLLVAVLIAFSSTAAAPFIYTLF